MLAQRATATRPLSLLHSPGRGGGGGSGGGERLGGGAQ